MELMLQDKNVVRRYAFELWGGVAMPLPLTLDTQRISVGR